MVKIADRSEIVAHVFWRRRRSTSVPSPKRLRGNYNLPSTIYCFPASTLDIEVEQISKVLRECPLYKLQSKTFTTATLAIRTGNGWLYSMASIKSKKIGSSIYANAFHVNCVIKFGEAEKFHNDGCKYCNKRCEYV